MNSLTPDQCVERVVAWLNDPRRTHLLPRMKCGHLGVVQHRRGKDGIESYPLCAHCGCKELGGE